MLETIVVTGFSFSFKFKLTSVCTLVIMVGVVTLGGVPVATCWAAALISAACRRDVLLTVITLCTGDGGAVVELLGKLIEDGGLSTLGEGTIIELSSMYFKSELSRPNNISYVILYTPCELETNRLFGLSDNEGSEDTGVLD